VLFQVSKKPATTPATSDAAPAPDFEASLAELEGIVEKLEHGELSLEESLKQFERGVQLTRVCQTALTQAEQKVEILLRKPGAAAGEEYETSPFETDDQDT
jgi:exodeoxyribonuclease VII small subunit